MPEKKEKSSLGRGLVEILKERIISGEFKNGESLTEMRLAQEYGMSRTPIREALRQLEVDGFVRIVPNKGAVAIRLTESEISDVFNIRIRVESMAAYLAAKNITPVQLEEMKSAQKSFEEHLDNQGDMKKTDLRFHDLIYEAAGSLPVKHVLQSMNSYIGIIRHESLKIENRAQQVAKEHRAILEAIEAGDAEKAERLAYEHIINAAGKNKACRFIPLGGENLQKE